MEIRLHVTVEGRHTTNQTMLVSLFVLGLNEIVVSGSGDVIAIEAPFKTGHTESYRFWRSHCQRYEPSPHGPDQWFGGYELGQSESSATRGLGEPLQECAGLGQQINEGRQVILKSDNVQLQGVAQVFDLCA